MPSAILISHYLPDSKAPSLVNYLGRYVYILPTFIDRILKPGYIQSGYVTAREARLDTTALRTPYDSDALIFRPTQHITTIDYYQLPSRRNAFDLIQTVLRNSPETGSTLWRQARKSTGKRVRKILRKGLIKLRKRAWRVIIGKYYKRHVLSNPLLPGNYLYILANYNAVLFRP